MEPSSIVSFNNDSTYQTTLKADCANYSSAHELALHAMRDRCLLLQRRINTLETENMRLKLDLSKVNESKTYMPLQEDEKLGLLQKIAELNKQKSQLMHHVFMVSCENKNLWNKVATMKVSDKNTNKEYSKQPLIRSNTYIHSTPKTNSNYQEKFSESSLEEISLKLINSYIQEKSQLVEQYEQMTQLQDMDDDILNLDSINFAYVEDPPTDSLKEICTEIEKLHNLKKELSQQEEDLKLVISKVQKVLNEGYECPGCRAGNNRVVTSENKEIETSDSLTNWTTPVASSNYNNVSEVNTPSNKKSNIGIERGKDDVMNKICPMCGETFEKEVTFIEFQSHVEAHFIGDIEPDSIIENEENSIENVM